MSELRLCISHIRCSKWKCWPWALRLVLGNKVLRWEKISPLFFISPILHSHHVPLPPTTALSPTPRCCYISMYCPQCCPPACLVRRIPESSPPSSPPTRLALILSEFKSRNFSPPRCFTPTNITESAKETDSWLSFQVPGQVVGCGSLQGSSAWSEVETCSGRMKNFGGSIAKMKGISQLSNEHVQVQLSKGV